ncbi:MAG: hypothetical protein FJ091_19895 [Deltaproteobacteria bacterium]|nr:hypothetical protein [Deltaproteobacteria bacterium]
MKRALLLLLPLSAFLGIVVFTSCTSLSHHTAPPYDRDAGEAAKIEARAAEWCTEHGEPAGLPTIPFRFDGCSWWLDRFGESDWRHCCEEHDYAYWCGGSAEDRKRADAKLGECVASVTSPGYGELMRLGVRVGGHPAVPLYFRWGYGHAYSGRYPEAKPPEAPAR